MYTMYFCDYVVQEEFIRCTPVIFIVQQCTQSMLVIFNVQEAYTQCTLVIFNVQEECTEYTSVIFCVQEDVHSVPI